MTDEEWVDTTDFTHHCCCFCNSVHSTSRKIKDGRVHERWTYDPKLTRIAKKAEQGK